MEIERKRRSSVCYHYSANCVGGFVGNIVDGMQIQYSFGEIQKKILVYHPDWVESLVFLVVIVVNDSGSAYSVSDANKHIVG